jgi:SpoIID/LytB domain protein
MRRLLGTLLVLAGAGLPFAVATAAPAGAFPADTVELAGRGFGHGRGMGQFGALGYALEHGRSYQQILDHYYGGTALDGSLGNPAISVRLTAFDGRDAIVQQERGHLVTNVGPPGQTYQALRAERIGLNTFRVYHGPGCAGPWAVLAAAHAGTVAFYPTVRGGDDHQEMVQACLPNGTKWYRGEFHVVDDGGSRLVNHVLAQDGGTDGYLRGVVPRESPASWGDLGGGAGMHALRAQAVAARSYAQAENRHPYAKTCDTQACQVYGGRAEQLAGSSFKTLEHPNTDRAVAETSGQVRRHAGGAVARTEFSSSTGGHTAGGTFPAVPDEGDSISLNPNHTWAAKVPVASIESKYGRGTLQSVDVVQRNGLGADGGRVVRMRLVFSGGVVERTGNEFRIDFGLKSDWFRVTNGVVGGYYTLGRDGGVFAFGSARFHGSLPGIGQRVGGRDIAVAGNGGYWVLGDNAGVYSFGGAPFFGSMAGRGLNAPPRQLVPTPSRNGYWIVAGDGGVFAFGDAGFFGSTGSMRLNAPVVGMAPTKSGQGYWLVARDGGVFSFGDAVFRGSTGSIRLNRPVNDMAATPSGNGYWLLGEDGGLFAFGDAAFFGSLPGRGVADTAVDLDASPTGGGYYITSTEGGVHAFGDVGFLGSPAGVGATSPTAALAIASS